MRFGPFAFAYRYAKGIGSARAIGRSFWPKSACSPKMHRDLPGIMTIWRQCLEIGEQRRERDERAGNAVMPVTQ